MKKKTRLVQSLSLIVVTFLTMFCAGCGSDGDEVIIETDSALQAAKDGSIAAETAPPRVVSAISTSNTTVTVTFSKPMGDSAEDPGCYSIVQENVNPEVGVLMVKAAQFNGPSHTSVQLTTLSQNEVSYLLSAVDVYDLAGNPMASPEAFNGGVIHPATTGFAGTPPGDADRVDSDGDGVSDNVEQRGRVVNILLSSGEIVARQVSSDPFNADTDGDGVNDAEELRLGSDPRDPDTDGDGLDDNLEVTQIYSSAHLQDTDGDGLGDGLEWTKFKTSPILADSDGDKESDAEEIKGSHRDPRIADLPRPKITVGEVRLQIDERYTYTDEEGHTVSQESSSSSTLAQSEDRRFSTSDTTVNQHVAGGDIKLGFNKGTKGFSSFGNISGHYSYTNENTFQSSQESSQTSQEVYQESLTKGREFTTSNSVTREVFGASIDVDLTIENAGNIAFSISNIEVTVLQRSRLDTSRFLPVATLVPNSTLITGQSATFNLGPFNSKRGPFIFSSREVFPNLVEELLKAPGGLIFKVANFDITDEFGRNFTFSNQTARDRTAGITIDYGDGDVDRYLVAVNGAPDDQAVAGGGFVGGFEAKGKARGIPLGYALQDILRLAKNSVTQDGIVAGLDQTADSKAQGDDVQLIPPDTTGLGVGSIVVAPGDNGVLDTIPLGDDRIEMTTGYETSRTCDALADNAGDICSLDSDCTNGTCSGPERLRRFGSRRTGDFGRQWVVMHTGNVPAGADFGEIKLSPGEDIFIAFVQDLDEDGLFAREEYLAGSTDSASDQFDNSTFGTNFDPQSPGARDGLADSKDTDRDGLGDYAEVNVGWKVSIDGGSLVNVYPNPRLRDSDGDGLEDQEEKDISDRCDPADTRWFCLPGSFSETLPPATDPTRRDTDFDEVSDFDELSGYGVGLSIIDGGDRIADTTVNGDDLQKVFEKNPTAENGVIILPGPDGIIDSTPGGDDLKQDATTVVTDPLRRDTYDDLVADGTELALGANPTDPNDGADFVDSDQDGLTDAEEDLGWTIIVNNGSPTSVKSNKSLPDSDFDGLPDFVERDIRTNPNKVDTDGDGLTDFDELADFEKYFGLDARFPHFYLNGSDSQRYGTDPTRADSDGDTLTDKEELVDGYRIWLAGETSARQIFTNPLVRDTDLDQLFDNREKEGNTDATDPDTDGDGRLDGVEISLSTDPLVPDVGVTVTFRNILINKIHPDVDNYNSGDPGGGDLHAEVMWWFFLSRPGQSPQLVSNAWDYGYELAQTYAPYRANWDDQGSFQILGSDDPSANGPLRVLQHPMANNVNTPDNNWWVTGQKCGQIQGFHYPNYYTLSLNKTEKIALQPGQTFEIEGLLIEVDDYSKDCGYHPTYVPTAFEASCATRFRKTFSFEDFSGQGDNLQLTFDEILPSGNTCDWEINVNVEAK